MMFGMTHTRRRQFAICLITWAVCVAGCAEDVAKRPDPTPARLRRPPAPGTVRPAPEPKSSLPKPAVASSTPSLHGSETVSSQGQSASPLVPVEPPPVVYEQPPASTPSVHTETLPSLSAPEASPAKPPTEPAVLRVPSGPATPPEATTELSRPVPPEVVRVVEPPPVETPAPPAAHLSPSPPTTSPSETGPDLVPVPSPPVPAEPALPTAQPGATSETKAPSQARAEVPAAEAGLEVLFWAASLDAATLGAALQPYELTTTAGAVQAGIDPAMLALWRSNGLRVARVPFAKLAVVQAALHGPGDPTSGTSATRQWLGQALVWTEAFRGPARDRTQTVALDAERLDLSPGALRVLARSWFVPLPGSEMDGARGTSGPRAALKIELLLQNFEPADRLTGLVANNLRAQDQGLSFTRLLCRWIALGDDALMIIPERQDVLWDASAQKSTDDTTDQLPPTPHQRTLGELMMMGQSPDGGGNSLRAVLVLQPHVPQFFNAITPAER